MNINTGGEISIGLGLIRFISQKQILNTKSSTEDEVVRIRGDVTFNIFIRLFMEVHGSPLKSNVVYQDNQMEIPVESNGWDSFTGNYFHIRIRYFLVKYRQD